MALWFIALVLSCLPSILAQEVTPRIVGGSATGTSDYPYFIRWGGCGATLIHNDIALGAAHVSQSLAALVHRVHQNDLISHVTAVVCSFLSSSWCRFGVTLFLTLFTFWYQLRWWCTPCRNNDPRCFEWRISHCKGYRGVFTSKLCSGDFCVWLCIVKIKWLGKYDITELLFSNLGWLI
jgi:hypothetical protein